MRIFVSYARGDREAVDVLLQDMRRAHHEVWVDEQLTGGQEWWNTILATIRTADVFVLALSPGSLKSKACNAEYAYATACKRTVLPVMVARVSPQMAPPAIANAQIIDYTERTPNAAISLVTALAAAPPPPPLPDPPPPPPTVPMTYMNTYRERLEQPSLTLQQQSLLFSELRLHLGDEDDHDTAVELIRRLRERRDITESVGREIDAVLAAMPRPGAVSAPWEAPRVAATSGVTDARSEGSAPVASPAATSSAPAGAFGNGEYIALIVASLFIPLVGIVVGAINLKKPERHSQAQVLLTVGIVSVVLVLLLTA